MTLALSLAAALLALACAAFSVRYAWWRRSVPYRHPRILMYHMVRPSRPGARFNKLRVAPAAFERQLRHLAEGGWRFAFLSELAAVSAEASPQKTVALTFDDGYRDNYLAAHPLLEKYDAKATLFLVADRHDRDWSVAKKAHHDSGELQAEQKLSDDEVRAMLASGRWELGAHTLTHALLPALDDTDRGREVAGGRQALETTFGVPVRTFAYPFGIYGEAEVKAAAEAGFTHAVTTEQGISTDLGRQALELKRVKVSGAEGRLGFALRLRTGRRGL